MAPVVSYRVGRDEAGHRAARWWLFIRCSLRPAPRRTTSAGAGVDSILAEMMEPGRWGDARHRKVRGPAARSPGVAHGGGDTLYPLLAPTCAAPNDIGGCRR